MNEIVIYSKIVSISFNVFILVNFSLIEELYMVESYVILFFQNVFHVLILERNYQFKKQ